MTSTPSPTISIYQDPSHIEGILQQLKGGILTEASAMEDSRETDGKDTGSAGGGELSASVKLPTVGGLKATGKLSGDSKIKTEVTLGSQETKNYKFTSAYYLHVVRQELRSAGLLKNIETLEEAKGLEVGDFVEFQAEFRPDEIIALMDVFNPHLVAEITRWIRKRQITAEIGKSSNEEEQQAAIVRFQTLPDADAAIAQAAAEAVRVDFRSTSTREYFGTIPNIDGFTTVVICDTTNFLVEDADRILDGYFTVLGKVGTPPKKDVPVLARNKVLDRIQPKAVDFAAQAMTGVAAQRVEDLDESNDERTYNEYLDLNFPSRIEGLSLKIFPVAVYL